MIAYYLWNRMTLERVGVIGYAVAWRRYPYGAGCSMPARQGDLIVVWQGREFPCPMAAVEAQFTHEAPPQIDGGAEMCHWRQRARGLPEHAPVTCTDEGHFERLYGSGVALMEGPWK